MLVPCLVAFVSLLAQGPRAMPAQDELVHLELPPSPPPSALLELPLAGTLARLELAPHSLRAPDAFVRVVGADGRSVDQPPPTTTTFRGRVRDDARSTVLAALLPEGWSAWIELGTGARFELTPTAERGWHALRRAAPEPAFTCGSPDDPAQLPPDDLEPFSAAPLGRRCLRLAEIAFDADLQYYQAKGSSVPGVVAAIDAILNQVDFFYARDVQITFELTAYVVRTTAFYQPTGGGDLLDLFRTEWNTNQTAIRRDLAHLMTGQPGSLIEFGGLAWVGTVCTNSQYGWSMDGANIVGHEVGHNFGAGHCHDLEPCNNMCGACFQVGPITREIILAFRDSRACLDVLGDRPPDVPPYAMPDGVRRRKDQLASGATFEVLQNDDDGDCEGLFLAAFEHASERGGSVQRAPQAGLAWRNRLQYTPPAEPFVGTDHFTYQVSDGTLAATGEVTVEGLALELLGYWPLDDAAGTLAADRSQGGRAGTLVGGPLWDAGQAAGALYFDGTNDRVSLPALNTRTDQLTLTCWVKRQGTQDDFAGLVFARSGNTVAGLCTRSGGGLRYTWNGESATYNFVPGLALPNGQWVFVALVVEPERATIYRHDGTLAWAVNAIHHAPEEFDGALRIGRDDAGGRNFQGWIDDVRLYGFALSAAEIARLAAVSGPADAPFPRDGGKEADPAGLLGWWPGLGATTHDVYLGTSYAAVRAANPSSPEFQGTFASASFSPGTLVPGTTYYWRVDEHTPSTLEAGHVWQFEPAEYHRWPLDETAGTTADDTAGGIDGTYLGGVTLAQPGATPSLGLAAAFDGVNDRVEVPALQLDSNRVTITCFLKRSGAQNPFSALAFSRAASTVAGLHFGNANELRYSWNDDGASWGWDSGLVVPDGQWVFAALVVEPTRARLYLGQAGTLSLATNAITHAAEEFDGKLVLGRDAGFSNRYFEGSLDDVRVYDHALTPAEVEALYLSSL